MKGYVVIDTETVDQEAYSQYVSQVVGVIERHGGRFIVRTSEVDPIEGGWAPKRLVIIEFESLEAARGFITSDEYTSLNDLRRRGANSHIVLAEGAG
jgi:uncharacterized protein (DUF1330 family)